MKAVVTFTKNWVVPTKQCRLIISISYISWLLLTHNEKSGGWNVIQGDILKPALLCRDYRRFRLITLREKGEEEAKRRTRLINRLAITRVESSQELGLIPGRLKATPQDFFC